MTKTEIFIFTLALISLAVGFYFYPQLPEQMASHWNAAGEVDGYMSKFWGVYLMPCVLIGMAVLFFLIPRIDPLRKNIAKFRSYYDGFIILMMLFMFAVYGHGLLWNLGTEISTNIFFSIGIGLILFYAGILCQHAKRNWFIGIRTPWTLSSEKVWQKTHKVGGKLFKCAGLIAILGVFFETYAIYFILVPTLGVTVYVILFSYFEYERGQR